MNNADGSSPPPAPAPETSRDAAQDMLIEQWTRGTGVGTEPAPRAIPSAPPARTVSFTPGPQDPPPPANLSLTPSRDADIAIGLLLMLGGIMVTVLTYDAASGGGMYVIAWGPVVYGFLRLMRGLSRGAG
ncbi:MAG TPA: hypothetical protein VM261_24215 [Kofleriaceae bacterium]|nr:hypothetical protein [Kofleriaceae bacterium]